ncbi:oligosaccharide flippase family protein [Rhodobacteraceae bacterium R_SAG2]|nr:oligosaccharide flippase family protein [Rhodobacteraceae bacterium R_SAG2]
MSDIPKHPSMRQLVPARLFGGTSGRVLRGMGRLTLGSGIGRVIGLASIPVLTRLYTPEDFGSLSVFTAFLQVLVPLATLGYFVVLPLPRSDRGAFAVLALCIGLAGTISLATGAIFFTFGETLFSWLDMVQLAPYWWLLAVGMLGASLYETLITWGTRERAYEVIARTQVVQSAVGEGLKILFGLLEVKPLGLLLGQVAGHSGGGHPPYSHFRAGFPKA